MPAAPPKRASASTVLTFGVLTVPVQLYAGIEDNRGVKRSEYTREGKPVGRAPIVKGSDPVQVLSPEDVIRCVETEHGLVELTDDERDKCIDLPDKQAEIVTFLPLHVMGSGVYMPDSLMQVRPAKGKKGGTYDPSAAKVFTLLMRAMRHEQVFALVRLNLRQPSYGALLPTGRLYRLLFEDEVREDLPLPEVDVSMDDIDMVRKIMDVQAEPPALTNEHRHLIQGYVDKKAKEGRTIDQQEIDEGPEIEDLLGSLRAAASKDGDR